MLLWTQFVLCLFFFTSSSSWVFALNKKIKRCSRQWHIFFSIFHQIVAFSNRHSGMSLCVRRRLDLLNCKQQIVTISHLIHKNLKLTSWNAENHNFLQNHHQPEIEFVIRSRRRKKNGNEFQPNNETEIRLIVLSRLLQWTNTRIVASSWKSRKWTSIWMRLCVCECELRSFLKCPMVHPFDYGRFISTNQRKLYNFFVRCVTNTDPIDRWFELVLARSNAAALLLCKLDCFSLHFYFFFRAITRHSSHDKSFFCVRSLMRITSYSSRKYLGVVTSLRKGFEFTCHLFANSFRILCVSNLSEISVRAIYFRFLNQDVPLTAPYLGFFRLLLNCNHKMCQWRGGGCCCCRRRWFPKKRCIIRMNWIQKCVMDLSLTATGRLWVECVARQLKRVKRSQEMTGMI